MGRVKARLRYESEIRSLPLDYSLDSFIDYEWMVNMDAYDRYIIKMMEDQDYEEFIMEQFLDENGNYWCDAKTKDLMNNGDTSRFTSEATYVELMDDNDREMGVERSMSDMNKYMNNNYVEKVTDDGTSSSRDLSLHMLEVLMLAVPLFSNKSFSSVISPTEEHNYGALLEQQPSSPNSDTGSVDSGLGADEHNSSLSNDDVEKNKKVQPNERNSTPPDLTNKFSILENSNNNEQRKYDSCEILLSDEEKENDIPVWLAKPAEDTADKIDRTSLTPVHSIASVLEQQLYNSCKKVKKNKKGGKHKHHRNSPVTFFHNNCVKV